MNNKKAIIMKWTSCRARNGKQDMCTRFEVFKAAAVSSAIWCPFVWFIFKVPEDGRSAFLPTWRCNEKGERICVWVCSATVPHACDTTAVSEGSTVVRSEVKRQTQRLQMYPGTTGNTYLSASAVSRRTAVTWLSINICPWGGQNWRHCLPVLFRTGHCLVLIQGITAQL